MHSAENAALREAYNESDVAPHDVPGGRDALDERIRIAPEDTHYDERLRWSRPDALQRGSALENRRSAGNKPSLGKRMVRATARFVVAVLIGVGATLAWQAYGDQARAMLATWDPSLAWLNPPAGTQPPAAAAVSAADLGQQLKPITLEIAALHHDLEQLAAKQDQLATNQGQLAQGLSTLQAAEREVGLKISSMTAPKPPVHAQPHHPAQIQPHEPTPLQPREAARRPVQPPDDSEGR